eukprot:56794-Eustigmatos_ZCMA.PRE.6
MWAQQTTAAMQVSVRRLLMHSVSASVSRGIYVQLTLRGRTMCCSIEAPTQAPASTAAGKRIVDQRKRRMACPARTPIMWLTWRRMSLCSSSVR